MVYCVDCYSSSLLLRLDFVSVACAVTDVVTDVSLESVIVMVTVVDANTLRACT